MSICKVWDEFMANYAERFPIWTVVLNNGETVYMDDGRPNVSPNSAWIRLHNYCDTNSLYIVHMTIGFRDNRHSLPDNADGYYFSLGAKGMWGLEKTFHLFNIGTLQNGVLMVQSWRVPEMLDEETEQRDYNEAGLCLIQNPNVTLPSLEQKIVFDQTNI